MSRFSFLLVVAVAAWFVIGCGSHPQRVLVSDPSTESGVSTTDPVGAGPLICFSHETFDFCYPVGGYCPCLKSEVPIEVEAGRPITVAWSARPDPATGEPIHRYRWSLDILDISDDTPRVDEATDLSRWSMWSANPGSATFGPWSVGEVHRLYVDVGDFMGMRSLGILRITVVPSTNQPPDCGAAFADRAMLWPPDHRLAPVGIRGVTDPDGDPVTIRVTRVSQDEPALDRPFAGADAVIDAAFGDAANGSSHRLFDGDGIAADHGGGRRTCPDAAIDDAGAVKLRAERSPHGDGRMYTIWFTASDPSGASCEGSVRVCVPRNRGHRECSDGGPLFDSLGPCGRGRGRQSMDP